MSYKEIKGTYARFTFAGFDVHFARNYFCSWQEETYGEWGILRINSPSICFDGNSKYTTTKLTLDSARRLFNCFCRDMVKKNNEKISRIQDENELLSFGAETVKSRKQESIRHKKVLKWIENLP